MKLHKHEQLILNKHKFIVGVDEAGRGPLAGPVIAAAVVLDKKSLQNKIWTKVTDSKKLSDKKRRELLVEIKKSSFDFGIGMCDHHEVDELNIHIASLTAMRRAVKSLRNVYEFVFIDGLYQIPDLSSNQVAVIRGDQQMTSIAAASIVAKVMRDDLMVGYAKKFPQFGFEEHKGYPTKFHRKKLAEHGPCEIHRQSYATVKEYMKS